MPSSSCVIETAKIINQERAESPVGIESGCDMLAVSVSQQTKEGQPMSTSKAVNQLKGKWIYRSLVNDKTLNTPFANLQFGLGIIEFKKIAGSRILNASLDMGNNLILTIGGEIAKEGGVTSLKWRGTGVGGSPTPRWVFHHQTDPSPERDKTNANT